MASSLTLDTGVLTIVRDIAASNSRELISKRNIVGVMPTNFQSKADYIEPSAWLYRYDTMTIVTFYLRDKSKLSIELQDLSNQPTWNGGTLADMDQAMSDINDWLPSISYIHATGGTTSEVGDWRYHTFNSTDNFVVSSLSNIPANNLLRVLVVAGGGGGDYSDNSSGCGGGGGGGVIENLSYLLTSIGTKTAIVGSGGTGGIRASVTDPTNGSDSFFESLAAIGGGRSGNNSGGSSGGSGGGVGRSGGLGRVGYSGTVGQGFASGDNLTVVNGSGGGGGGGVGQNAQVGIGGNGGVGFLSTITNLYYAGGGGAGGWVTSVAGTGGNGGGGNGSNASGSSGQNGTANTGGGAGGNFGFPDNVSNGGNGGSGIVIIGYKFQN